MKLVGFGCSFTYGSELINPSLPNADGENHHANTPYREKHCWLGQLALLLQATPVNMAEPGNSNTGIHHQFHDWVNKAEYENCVVCIGWTEMHRTSWYHEDQGRWLHSRFIETDPEETQFRTTHKEWLSYGQRPAEETRNAKLAATATAKMLSIPLIQFDALKPTVQPKHFLPNYFQQNFAMQNCLDQEQIRLSKNFFAPGGHPNEQGHAYYAGLMNTWIQARNILN